MILDKSIIELKKKELYNQLESINKDIQLINENLIQLQRSSIYISGAIDILEVLLKENFE